MAYSALWYTGRVVENKYRSSSMQWSPFLWAGMDQTNLMYSILPNNNVPQLGLQHYVRSAHSTNKVLYTLSPIQWSCICVLPHRWLCLDLITIPIFLPPPDKYSRWSMWWQALWERESASGEGGSHEDMSTKICLGLNPSRLHGRQVLYSWCYAPRANKQPLCYSWSIYISVKFNMIFITGPVNKILAMNRI